MTVPQPPSMLAVILGASHYPESPRLTAGKSFTMSAVDMEEYVRGEDRGLAVPKDNILYLFDDSRSGGDQVSTIGKFLSRRCPRIADKDGGPEVLLVYYVGHGLFTRGDEHAYCLAVRSTEESNVGGTSIRASDLASTIKEHAPFLRRYLILDCCFSARAYSEFMGAPLAVASEQLRDELPPSGTALLCSSSASDVSLAPVGHSHTMFTGALIKALNEGDRRCGPRLSLSDLGALVKRRIEEDYGEEWRRPEVHSPDQRKGDIAAVPLFPNPAYQTSPAAARRAEKARLAREKAETKAAAARHVAAELAERERRGRAARESAKKARATRLARAKTPRRDIGRKSLRLDPIELSLLRYFRELRANTDLSFEELGKKVGLPSPGDIKVHLQQLIERRLLRCEVERERPPFTSDFGPGPQGGAAAEPPQIGVRLQDKDDFGRGGCLPLKNTVIIYRLTSTGREQPIPKEPTT